MKKLLMALVLLTVTGGVIYYQSRPTTVEIPVAVYDESPYDAEFDETIPEMVETSTTVVERPVADFSNPDLFLHVEGVSGDDVDLQEVIGSPVQLDALPDDIEMEARDCMGVTDRDMAVQVDVQLELLSNLEAEIDVDYGNSGQMAVFDFDDGPVCKSDGRVQHTLVPDSPNYFTYWVILSGAVTPESNLNQSWTLSGPVLTLPNLERMYWKMWGPSVISCDGLFGEVVKVQLAGKPFEQRDCDPATTETEAAGNL